MTRRVQTVAFHAAGAAPAIDTYFDRVVKYIPGDIVAAWVTVSGLVKAAGNGVPQGKTLWLCFVVGVVLTAAWTWKQTSVTGLPAAAKQIAVSTIAFCVWAFALGAPFDTLSWYHPLYPSLLLIGYTLAVGLVVE